MISESSFKRDEILKATRNFEKADPSIVEIVIYAFNLLEQLVYNELDFIFKGGTSLMLLFETPIRFSTDIDIITTESRERIENILDKICEKPEFSKWEIDKKRSYQEGVPKAHYKLYFNSQLEGRERELLLDILFEESSYPVVESVNIQLPFLKSDESSLAVKLPSIESILGDKLTAFAPNTIGILYNKGKGRDIIKQIFDIGQLFAQMEDINTVANSFHRIAEKEIKYRDLNIDITEIANDILESAFFFVRILRKKTIESEAEKVKEIKDALIAFRPFIASGGSYLIESLIHDASVAAYLVSLFATNKTLQYKAFANTINIKDYLFSATELNYLNRLEKLPGGSLYYLKSAYDLLSST